MIRYLLWLIVLLMVLRIIKIFTNLRQNRPSEHIDLNIPDKQSPSFDNIQDADFEDVTPKPPAPPPSS